MSEKSKQQEKFHNPKSNYPAVYIPCWLIQIPASQLSHQAKLLYGRLSQWSSANGVVHRSIPQLSEEIGVCLSTLKRTLQELKKVGLIKTYQEELGGINHYRFLEHAWMNALINKNLDYLPQPRCEPTPSPDVDLPQPRCGLPKVERNKKEIKVTTYVDPSDTTSVDNFDKSKQTKGKVDDDYKDNPLFAKFYLSYPNKQKPKEAYKAFLKLNPDKEFVEMLLKDIDKRIAKDVRWKTNQYTPHPATYLKSDYWMGDIITEAKPKPRYPNKEERAENEKKIREREERAIQLKKEESAAAKRIFGKMGVNYNLSYD